MHIGWAETSSLFVSLIAKEFGADELKFFEFMISKLSSVLSENLFPTQLSSDSFVLQHPYGEE